MKEVVLDTETTGISVKDGHRLVEIGCIELENLVPTKNKFHCYLNPERKVSEKALEVHGYTDDFLASQKKFRDVGEEFLNFIKDKRLIIHNAEFDLGHLNNELSLFGKKKIDNEIVDTLILARDKFPGSPVSLDALCKRYRVDNSSRIQHTALIDCNLLAKVARSFCVNIVFTLLYLFRFCCRFFVGNIYFALMIDYFSIESNRNLIINLWSLRVEEQC